MLSGCRTIPIKSIGKLIFARQRCWRRPAGGRCGRRSAWRGEGGRPPAVAAGADSGRALPRSGPPGPVSDFPHALSIENPAYGSISTKHCDNGKSVMRAPEWSALDEGRAALTTVSGRETSRPHQDREPVTWNSPSRPSVVFFAKRGDHDAARNR